MSAVAFSLPAVTPAGLGELVQAVIDAANAERAYYEGRIDPRSLRDLELFAAKIAAEADLAARLSALGVSPRHARTMAEALS